MKSYELGPVGLSTKNCLHSSCRTRNIFEPTRPQKHLCSALQLSVSREGNIIVFNRVPDSFPGLERPYQRIVHIVAHIELRITTLPVLHQSRPNDTAHPSHFLAGLSRSQPLLYSAGCLLKSFGRRYGYLHRTSFVDYLPLPRCSSHRHLSEYRILFQQKVVRAFTISMRID